MAWDSWAFLEVLSDGPNRHAVEQLLHEVDFVFTVREVVAETFNFIVRRTRRTADAWTWWNALSESRVRVFEPSLKDVHEFMAERPREGGLSFTDYALAFMAIRERTTTVATQDTEFRKMKLDPVFAKK